MSKTQDPLSDEASHTWLKRFEFQIPPGGHVQTWQECRQRARANRWAAFSDDELGYLHFVFKWHRDLAQILGAATKDGRNLWDDVHAELGRRQKGSK